MDAVQLSGGLQNRIGQVQRSDSAQKPDAIKNDQNSFGNLFMKSLDDVNSVQKSADQMVKELATGDNPDIHKTMIAVEKADISFQLMLQVRNKLVAAYQEINRMQV
jgi:flagellar hook-basal body complex protein FliE